LWLNAMGKVEIKLNRAGVRELLRSAEMRQICVEQAQAIAARAGNDYATDSRTGVNRVNASVYPATAEASRDNMKNNTLLKAVKG